MNIKLSISILPLVVGLSALLVLSGQAMATTPSLANQPAPDNLNFEDGFSNLQPRLYVDYKFSIPKASADSMTSKNRLESVFANNNLHSGRYGGAITISGESGRLQRAWGGEFATPRTIFSVRDEDINLPRWVDEDHEKEISEELGGSDDGIYVSPVPEAGEWALMLAGFSLIGFVANRRRWNAGFDVA
jgi:hypothetical protein